MNMFTLPDALCVGNSPVDTGLEKFASAVPLEPPHLDDAIAADCKFDIASMRAASRVDAERAEKCLIEANALHERIIERQRFIDEYSRFLLEHGRAAE